MTATPLSPELEQDLRRLRLKRIREVAPEVLQTAKTQRWPPEDLLATLVVEEIRAREASNRRRRMRQASFPPQKTLDGFDLDASNMKHATFEYLGSLEWLTDAQNLALCGPAGVGKSHIAQALGRKAIDQGKRVRFFCADHLIEELHRGLADNSVGRLIESLLRNDLIIVDDLGFTAMDRVAAEHLFRFVAAAYERRSLVITTNVEFKHWTRFLPDETVAQAILDRFLHHCHVIGLSGESYRLRESRKVVTP